MAINGDIETSHMGHCTFLWFRRYNVLDEGILTALVNSIMVLNQIYAMLQFVKVECE